MEHFPLKERFEKL